MKYLITESHFDNIIFKYLDEMFPEDNVNYTSQYEYDDMSGEEGDDECRILFYLGDYDEDESIFRWYDKCYWNVDTWQGEKQASRSPIVEIDEPYDRYLYGMFGDNFKEPFMKWFSKRFDLPVKSVTI